MDNTVLKTGSVLVYENEITMSTAVQFSADDVTPEEIAAIEKVLQHIDRQNFKKTVLAPLANWLLALRIYKETELRYACMKDRSRVAQAHRALLSAIMGAGECFVAASEHLTDEDLKCIHITKAALLSNVEYLRTKYSQWYAKRDPSAVRSTMAAIENARPGCS